MSESVNETLRIEASYLTINCNIPVERTIEVRPDLNVDVNRFGRIHGIERIGGTVDVDALTAVLRSLRMFDAYTVNIPPTWTRRCGSPDCTGHPPEWGVSR